VTDADSGLICTDLQKASRNRPPPPWRRPRAWTSLVEIEAEWIAGMIRMLAGIGQAHERVVVPQGGVEGQFRRHLAFVFEVGCRCARPSGPTALADLFRAAAHRITEGRIGHEGHAGLEAQVAHGSGGFRWRSSTQFVPPRAFR